MPSSLITKQAIAAAMKQLMQKIPFDRISIQDITQECGVSRKTFYYHFQDKYDLVNWIFSSEIMDSILSSTTLRNWSEGSLKLCRYIRENKAFYTNAMAASGQNCFRNYLYNLTEKQITLLVGEACSKWIIPEQDIRFMIDFYYNAFIGVLSQWVKDDMKDSPEAIVERWKCAVGKNLELYIDKIAAGKTL